MLVGEVSIYLDIEPTSICAYFRKVPNNVYYLHICPKDLRLLWDFNFPKCFSLWDILDSLPCTLHKCAWLSRRRLSWTKGCYLDDNFGSNYLLSGLLVIVSIFFWWFCNSSSPELSQETKFAFLLIDFMSCYPRSLSAWQKTLIGFKKNLL